MRKEIRVYCGRESCGAYKSCYVDKRVLVYAPRSSSWQGIIMERPWCQCVVNFEHQWNSNGFSSVIDFEKTSLLSVRTFLA